MIKLSLDEFDIEKIAHSGQCFRMRKTGTDEWSVAAGSRVCRAEISGGEVLILCDSQEDEFWTDYFDSGTDYASIRKSICADYPHDDFLRSSCEAGKGIRILKQDPWEMLITFIISQQNRIPRIASLVDFLARNYGSCVSDGIYAFPTPAQLCKASEDDLKKASFGYRSGYIAEAAKKVCGGDVHLGELSALSDSELKKELMSFRGVGNKVADCIMLFGYHRVDAVPVDTWMKKIMDGYYVGRLPQCLCGQNAGIIQQYMFYCERLRAERI